MNDLYIPKKLKQCYLYQALEYLGLDWVPWSMEDEYIMGRKRYNDTYIYHNLYPDKCSWEEKKYWEGLEKGCAILQKAIKMKKIKYFYGRNILLKDNTDVKVKFNGYDAPDIIDLGNFQINMGTFDWYDMVKFNTTQIEQLLKNEIKDDTQSPLYKQRKVKEIARKLINQKIYEEQEVYKKINEELSKQGNKQYSRKSLDRILQPLNLPLVKCPRGRPKKGKIER